jgi:hypothetical protein
MKPIAYLRFFTLSMCIFIFQNIQAQEVRKDPVRSRNNVIKTNILSPLSIGYERAIGQHFSLTCYYLHLPKFSYGSPESNLGYAALNKPSQGYTLEARYYTSKRRDPMNGFFIGGYTLYRTLEVVGEKSYTTNGTTYNIKVTVPSALTSYGGMLGFQRISKGGFTFNMTIGAGYYKFANIPVLDNTSDGQNLDALSQALKYSDGIAPRVNIALGYAF